MKDRIELNGIWYVREQLEKGPEPQADPVHYIGTVWEFDDYSINVIRIKREDGSLYDGFNMEITHKKTKEVEYIDNDRFILGLMAGEVSNPGDAETLDKDLRDCIIYVGNKLVDMGYFKH